MKNLTVTTVFSYLTKTVGYEKIAKVVDVNIIYCAFIDFLKSKVWNRGPY